MLVYRCRGMPIIANMPSVLLVFFFVEQREGRSDRGANKTANKQTRFSRRLFISMVVVGLLAAATATVGRGRYFNT